MSPLSIASTLDGACPVSRSLARSPAAGALLKCRKQDRHGAVGDNGEHVTEGGQTTNAGQCLPTVSCCKSTADIVAGTDSFHGTLRITRTRPREVLPPHDDDARRFSCRYRFWNR
jgi:hypothetical protein